MHSRHGRIGAPGALSTRRRRRFAPTTPKRVVDGIGPVHQQSTERRRAATTTGDWTGRGSSILSARSVVVVSQRNNSSQTIGQTDRRPPSDNSNRYTTIHHDDVKRCAQLGRVDYAGRRRVRRHPFSFFIIVCGMWYGAKWNYARSLRFYPPSSSVSVSVLLFSDFFLWFCILLLYFFHVNFFHVLFTFYFLLLYVLRVHNNKY